MMNSLSDNSRNDNSEIRIAVFGAGAVGKYISTKLLQGKISFDLIARGPRAALLKSAGLVVTDNNNNEHTYNVNVKESLEGKYDIIFLTVKSNDTLDAAITIKPHISDTSLVVSLQNGVENPSLLATILPSKTVVATVIYVTAVNTALHKLRYYTDAKIFYNNYIDNGNSISSLEKIFNSMAIKSTISSDIRKDQWSKLLFNIVANPLTALFGYTYTQFLEDRVALDIARRIFDEALGAANILGIDLRSDEFDKIIVKVRGAGSFKSSMLQDIEANRTPELDGILGAVGRVYKSKNLSSSSNIDMLLDIMQVKYGGYFHTSPKLAADILVYHDRKVLLIERKNEPLGYAIPGGFIDMRESVETAAIRELEEETGIVAKQDELTLLGVYSDPLRDPRGRTISIIYTYESKEQPEAADDALSAKYFDIDHLPEHMAFDHREVIRDFGTKIIGR